MMSSEHETHLQQDFPLLRNTFCDCQDGWYELIHDLCQAITERYEQEGKSVDLVATQVKQKYAGLRFYYEYEEDSTDDATMRLRNDIGDIVSAYEEKSETICEDCGAAGELREWNDWYLTLCDSCWKKYLEKKTANKYEN